MSFLLVVNPSDRILKSDHDLIDIYTRIARQTFGRVSETYDQGSIKLRLSDTGLFPRRETAEGLERWNKTTRRSLMIVVVRGSPHWTVGRRSPIKYVSGLASKPLWVNLACLRADLLKKLPESSQVC